MSLFPPVCKKGWMLLVALSLVSFSACQRCAGNKREKVWIFGVDSRILWAPEGVTVDSSRTQGILEKAISSSDYLERVENEGEGVYRLEFAGALTSTQVAPDKGQDGASPYAVQVQMVLSRWLNKQDQEKVVADGQAALRGDAKDPKRFQEAYELAMADAIQKAIRIVDLQMESRGLPVAQLEKMLKSERVEDRLYVLRALRERKNPEMVPRVIALLSDPDPEVVKEAIGVLVAQKDPRAVVPLVSVTSGKDTVFLMQVITALGEIQGPVARGYLFTLAGGHNAPQVRARAKEALEQIRHADKASQAQAESTLLQPPKTTEPKAPGDKP